MTTTPQFLSNVKDAAVTLVNGDGTAFKSFLAGSASGLRLKSLIVTSDDTSSRTLQFCKTIGGTDYILGEVTIPAGAGTDGVTQPVDVFDQAQTPGLRGLQFDGLQRFLDVANGTTIKVKAKVAVTAAKTVYLTGEYGEL